MMTSRIGSARHPPMPGSLSGFSLLEVILSVVILSVGLIAINQTLLRSLSALHLVETRFEAARISENKIWEMQNQALHEGRIPNAREQSILLGQQHTFSYELLSERVPETQSLYAVNLAVYNLGSSQRTGLTRTFYVRLPYAPKS